MRVARAAVKAIGWIFVAAIGYHAVRGAGDAARAGSRGNWPYAVELGAITLVAAALVIAALAGAVRSGRGRASRRRARPFRRR